MLMPKRTKYRKQMKGRNRGYATRGNALATGEFAIKAVEVGRINSPNRGCSSSSNPPR